MYYACDVDVPNLGCGMWNVRMYQGASGSQGCVRCGCLVCGVTASAEFDLDLTTHRNANRYPYTDFKPIPFSYN